MTGAAVRAILPHWATTELSVRRYFFEVLSFVLLLGSLVFFYECVRFLSRRDYVSAILLMFIGFAVIRVGAELARLALIDRH